MSPLVHIRPQTTDDAEAVFQVNALAFETEAEAQLIEALHQSGDVELSLVAELAGDVVGHLLLSSLHIESPQASIPALALAPMAVLPLWQRQGVGSALVTEGLKLSRSAGHRIVVVLGHPEFYPRFGFSAELARPLESPFSGEAWMACELVTGALTGVAGRVRYAEPFGLA